MKSHCPSPARMILGAVLLGCVLMAVPVVAQTSKSVGEMLSDVIKSYTDADFDKGITAAHDLMLRKDLNAKDSVAIYAALSMLTYAKGEQYLTNSFEFLEKIAAMGPCTIHLPYEFWPQQVRDQWYKILHNRGALTCPEEANPTVKTIAIMEFDNYSTGKYQQELGFVTKGLADFFENDFSKISSLKVVERDKIDYILKEIQLSQSGAVSSSTAVQVGKLLGAQLMVFGSVTQIDDKTAKMLIKVVKVETSEIIASVDREGKPDLFKMEKELVPELAKKLDLTINPQTKALLEENGTESADAATLYSKGLYYMDQYDYKKAYEFFKSAYEKDNNFAEAKRKMDIYRPLAAS